MTSVSPWPDLSVPRAPGEEAIQHHHSSNPSSQPQSPGGRGRDFSHPGSTAGSPPASVSNASGNAVRSRLLEAPVAVKGRKGVPSRLGTALATVLQGEYSIDAVVSDVAIGHAGPSAAEQLWSNGQIGTARAVMRQFGISTVRPEPPGY
jgi:hypothetical protein